MESPLITTAEFLMGARPEPSIRVAPRMTTVVMSCNMGHRLTLIGYGLWPLIFRLISFDVVSQFFGVVIVGFLFQKFFVLDGSFVFHSDGVIERRKTEVRVS